MAERGPMRSEIRRRRTFAIISHPDAGKTTLTEKLLLNSGVIRLAGEVRAKRGRAYTVSDWMEMEREKGISITTSVLQFPYGTLKMNLLDTPGHADFSEDTYRTLHAVDGVVMLLDCSKGVELQTRKLFRACRHRDIPIFSFVNKMDRPGRDPLDLVGEVEMILGIGVVPITWPMYRSGFFRGVYHRITKNAFIFDENHAASNASIGKSAVPHKISGIDHPSLRCELGNDGYTQFREEIELLDEAGDIFSQAQFETGHISPMFFGSAKSNFGIETFLETFSDLMPPPSSRRGSLGVVPATSTEFSGFVFKVQANMNRAHHDRLAFVRICSGQYVRGMKVHHVRLDRDIRIASPAQLLAQERNIVDEAFAGDVLGVFNTGLFEIGDTLTEGSNFEFEKIPHFAPEHFARLVLQDPMRRKQLVRGISQLAKEGTIQIYRTPGSRAGEMYLGAVGQLQMEVTQYRLKVEYGTDVWMDPLSFRVARWISPKNGKPLNTESLQRNCSGTIVIDECQRPIILFENDWSVRTAEKRNPNVDFAETTQGVVVRDA